METSADVSFHVFINSFDFIARIHMYKLFPFF